MSSTLISSRLEQLEPKQQPLRVLLVLGVLWGENGITSHLLTLAKGLKAQGWNVALASGLANNSQDANEQAIAAVRRFEAEGFQHFLIPYPDLRLSPSNLASAVQASIALNGVIRQFKPDVIHVHSLSVCPYVQIMRRLHRIPFVSTCHMEPAPGRLNVKLGGLTNRLLGDMLGDRAIAISSTLKQAFVSLMKIPEENIRLIYHGIDDAYFRPPTLAERQQARQQFGLSDADQVICLIGRLAPEKGHAVLIQALAILRAAGLEAIALFAGKGYGDEVEHIQAQAAQAEVSDLIRLLGFTDPRQALWASDVLTLPSRSGTEAFPLVIPESMLCGVVPIRTPASGAFDQIEDGIDGFIVPFDDSQVLAARLQQLIKDDALRSSMAAAALQSAQRKFTLNRMISDTMSVYRETFSDSIHSLK